MSAGTPAQDGRQARWQRHNAVRRQDIIEAAVAVIEEGEPGAEVQVQQIAARAGLSRTVVYRHFSDRADLDRAVQAAIIDMLWAELLPGVSLDGTAQQIIERVVSTYIRWAEAHPALHRMADHDVDGTDGPLEEGLELLAGRIAEVIAAGLLTLGASPTEEQVEALDPLVYGLVGAVFSAVRRWLSRGERGVDSAALITLVSQSLWYVVDGHARTLGIVIDPQRPLDELVADVLATQPAVAGS